MTKRKTKLNIKSREYHILNSGKKAIIRSKDYACLQVQLPSHKAYVFSLDNDVMFIHFIRPKDVTSIYQLLDKDHPLYHRGYCVNTLEDLDTIRFEDIQFTTEEIINIFERNHFIFKEQIMEDYLDIRHQYEEKNTDYQ